MSLPDWVRIDALDHVPVREGRVVHIRGRDIAVFNLGDRWLAVDNRCPHRGGPLADGIVTGHAVVCPLHGWKVDLAAGTVERPSGTAACIARYDVRIVDGFVAIALPAGLADARPGEAA